MMLPPPRLTARGSVRLLHARAATRRLGPRRAGYTQAEPQA